VRPGRSRRHHLRLEELEPREAPTGLLGQDPALAALAGTFQASVRFSYDNGQTWQ
jgi:hypothetical protein